MADINDMLKNFASMMDGKEIPDNVKEALGSFINNSNNGNGSNSSNNSSNGGSSNTDNSNRVSQDNSSMPNIDMGTLLKMQQIMSAMNSQTNNSGATLLRSLKPYLKPSRQAKVDEYIQLLSLEKVIGLMNNSGGDKKNGS